MCVILCVYCVHTHTNNPRYVELCNVYPSRQVMVAKMSQQAEDLQKLRSLKAGAS